MGRMGAEVHLYTYNISMVNAVCVTLFRSSQGDKGAVEPFMGHVVYSLAAISSTKDTCEHVTCRE